LALALLGVPRGSAAQDTAAAHTAVDHPIILLVRDASSGLPLDAVQVVRAMPGAAPVVLGHTNASGRVAIAPKALATPDETGARTGLVFQRIGYAMRTIAASEVGVHLAEHAATTHEILLAPQPAMLSTIGIEAAVPNQLAAGTALAMATATGA